MPSSVVLKAVGAWLALATIAALLASLAGEDEPETPAERRAERADVGGPFPLELRSPQVVAGTSARVLIGLRRPSLAEAVEQGQQRGAAQQRAYVRSLDREARALMSALEARGVDFGRPVLYARVWSGFAATIATKDLPEVQSLGLRVESVSRFYPAQVPADDAPGTRPLPTKAADTGPIAVVDAFPPRGAGGHDADARLAADVVGPGGNRRISAAERAGERIAAVIGGELPKAPLVRIRAAGSQPLETGKFQVFGTSDQLLAAFERAVDPDQDGDASDAPPVAVTGLSAPYSGFERSPVAEAVDATTTLGTLVVAAAGNGGEPEGVFGSVGSPGAARSALTVGALDDSGDPAQASSRGPTYGLAPKPDLAIGGGAETDAGTAWGTAIAAARVAGVAAALRAERPELSPREAAAALVGTAAPRGEPKDAGGGDPLLQAARVTEVVADPPQLVLKPGGSARVRLRVLLGSPNPAVKAPEDVNAVRERSSVRITVAPDAEPGGKRVEVGSVTIPVHVLDGNPPEPPIGPLRIVRRRGQPAGVRFTAGSIERGDDGAAIVPVGNLVLTLSGPSERRLTPPGGARDLLPGEYAYTLTDEIKARLEPGVYRFAVRARGSAGGQAVLRFSRRFRLR